VKSRIFSGRNAAEIERKLTAWISAHPSAILKKRYAVENLPADTSKLRAITDLRVPDLVSMRIDYVD
jgi:hypothetical protein